jgi:hypothetical protein
MIDQNAYYHKFLLNHKKYEDIINYYQLWQSREEKLIIKEIVAYYKK